MKPFLTRTNDSFIFSPTQTTEVLDADTVAGRTHYTDSYSTDSYRRAVERAAQREGVEKWTPNQLRHTFATAVRKRFGLEATQTSLGHSKADVTQIYAERDEKLAEMIAREVG